MVTKLCEKSAREAFEGGRPGYDKEKLFGWLLVKKVTNWDYQTIASMAEVSHPTLIRANELFLKKNIYRRVFVKLVKTAYRRGLIQGEYVALDSSFVETFSKRQEEGSGDWSGHKKAYGFKLHLLVDVKTKFPMALIVGGGTSHDSPYAIPLLKKGRSWLKRVGYVLADKGYDDCDIVSWIVKNLKAKAAIPMRKKDYRGKGHTSRYGNVVNWRLKAVGRTFKKSILKKRTEIEGCFSRLKRTFHLGHEETRGIIAFAKNVYLTLISYMLKLFDIAGITQV